jgi:hypothetical protein
MTKITTDTIRAAVKDMNEVLEAANVLAAVAKHGDIDLPHGWDELLADLRANKATLLAAL